MATAEQLSMIQRMHEMTEAIERLTRAIERVAPKEDDLIENALISGSGRTLTRDDVRRAVRTTREDRRKPIPPEPAGGQ